MYTHIHTIPESVTKLSSEKRDERKYISFLRTDMTTSIFHIYIYFLFVYIDKLVDYIATIRSVRFINNLERLSISILFKYVCLTGYAATAKCTHRHTLIYIRLMIVL